MRPMLPGPRHPSLQFQHSSQPPSRHLSRILTTLWPLVPIGIASRLWTRGVAATTSLLLWDPKLLFFHLFRISSSQIVVWNLYKLAGPPKFIFPWTLCTYDLRDPTGPYGGPPSLPYDSQMPFLHRAVSSYILHCLHCPDYIIRLR